MNICIPQRSHSAQACTRRSKQWLCGVYTRISLVSSGNKSEVARAYTLSPFLQVPSAKIESLKHN